MISPYLRSEKPGRPTATEWSYQYLDEPIINRRRKMEKIGLCKINGKPIIGRVEHDEAVLKVNEIVEEIKHLWVNLIDLQKEMLKIHEGGKR